MAAWPEALARRSLVQRCPDPRTAMVPTTASLSVKSEPAAAPEHPQCASCDTPLAGAYCHVCGEKRLDRHDYALGHFLEHTVDAFTHFDFKVPRSLWSLLRHPGVMTADVLAGRRMRWAKPIQVFLIANLIYYVAATTVGLSTFQTPLRFHQRHVYGALAQRWSAAQATELGLTATAYAERFDALAHTLAKTLVIFFVPVFALLFGLLLRRARRYTLEHVVVAMHFTSLVLLVLLLPFPLVLALVKSHLVDRLDADAIWTFSTGILIGFYASRFMLRVYGSRHKASIGQGILTAAVFYLMLQFVYRPLLFFIVHALL